MTDTTAIGYIRTNSNYYGLYKSVFTDGTAAEFQVLDIAGAAQSLGKIAKGQTILEYHVQLATGSILAQTYISTGTGAIKFKSIGCERTSNQRGNIQAVGLSIPIDEGMKIYCNCAD